MIELKNKFKKHGNWEYTQLIKRDNIVVYKKVNRYDDGYVSVAYELFDYKIHGKDAFHDDEYEILPSDACFGLWAWDCSCIGSCKKVLKKHFPTVNMEEVMKIILESFRC